MGKASSNSVITLPPKAHSNPSPHQKHLQKVPLKATRATSPGALGGIKGNARQEKHMSTCPASSWMCRHTSIHLHTAFTNCMMQLVTQQTTPMVELSSYCYKYSGAVPVIGPPRTKDSTAPLLITYHPCVCLGDDPPMNRLHRSVGSIEILHATHVP
jgi:hypothetical protein